MPRSPAEDQHAPLGKYLTRQAAAGQRRVELPFTQIEVAILRRALPPRARQPRDWWQNRGTEQHAWYGWLRAGWFAGAVSLATETVTFTRGGDEERGWRRANSRARSDGKHARDQHPPRSDATPGGSCADHVLD